MNQDQALFNFLESKNRNEAAEPEKEVVEISHKAQLLFLKFKGEGKSNEDAYNLTDAAEKFAPGTTEAYFVKVAKDVKKEQEEERRMEKIMQNKTIETKNLKGRKNLEKEVGHQVAWEIRNDK